MTYINPRSKLFGHLDRLQAIKEGRRPAPVNVEIDLSNRCSLGCAWCHFAYTHTRGPLTGKQDKPDGAIVGGDLMDADLAVQILCELWDSGVKSVTWTGGGEPTLHPRFDSLIQYAASLGLEQGIYTHGGHLHASRAEMVKALFTWAFVSLDECERDSYQRSKGVDRFDAACAGIRHLVQAEGEATIGVGFLLHEGNYRQLYNMRQLGQELGASYVQFRPTVHYDTHHPSALAEDTAWMDEAIALLEQYAGDSFVIADVDRFKMYRDWNGHGYSQCYWSALQTVITPNGKVWRCTNKREHPDALLGDLSVESFADVWARSGGPCAVGDTCRVLCRGHIANTSLDSIMTAQAHGNFI